MTKQLDTIYLFPHGYAGDCVTTLEDLPGRVRKSFYTSLQNVLIAQVGKRTSRNAVELIDSAFITDVLVHMRNIACYNVVWADYIFGVSEDAFKKLLVKKINNLCERNVSDHELRMYNDLAEYVVNYLKNENKEEEAEKEKLIWLPVPTDFFEYNHKRKLLGKRQYELWNAKELEREKV